MENDSLIELEQLNAEYLDYTTYENLSIFSLVADVFKLIICICVIVADIFLITVICKNKKLQSPTNAYILHFAIFNIVAILAAPMFYSILELLPISNHAFPWMTFFCIETQTESAGLMLCYLFGVGLGFEWLLHVYNPNFAERYQYLYKYSIHVIYFLGILNMTIGLIICFVHQLFRQVVLLFVYGSALIFIAYMNFLNHRLKPTNNKKSYTLTIANIIIFSWLPMFIHGVLFDFLFHKHIIRIILLYMACFMEWIGYFSSILIIYILGKLNKDFQGAYDKVFKKSVKDYNDQENLDESDEEQHNDNNLPSNPTFI